jgi:hypothetical protein
MIAIDGAEPGGVAAVLGEVPESATNFFIEATRG